MARVCACLQDLDKERNGKKMKKTIAMVLLAAADPVQAFDNTVKNDFWDTTAYVNATVRPEASAASAAPASSFAGKTYFSGVIEFFSTLKNGFRMIFR